MPPPSPLSDNGASEKLETKMRELALKEKELETERRAKTLGIPSIALHGFPISPEALIR